MTQDEIIELARKAGLHLYVNDMTEKPYAEFVVAFANLVAQEVRDRIMFGSRDDWVLAEREACAKVCDVLAVHPEYASEITKLAAQAIRNRG